MNFVELNRRFQRDGLGAKYHLVDGVEGAKQSSERIGLVGAMISDGMGNGGVRDLHEQRTHSAEIDRGFSIDSPGLAAGTEKPVGLA